MRLQEVGYLRCLAGLASLGDWRGFCLCSEFIPSVTERSALFVKELLFPQTAPTNDAFSTRTGLERVRIAGPELELSLGRSVGSGCWTPLQKQEKRGSAGARSLPLRCLSQFFPVEENINFLGNEVLVHKSAYLSPMG